ncbi:MAG: nucleotidyltransferase domain-containing protein [Actinomycetota bacterium]|nr:nucleotidyltransferase domain-containing protein [Actinomycetota bacterium]
MTAHDLANVLAGRLKAVPGVQAVALGGSWARGAGDAHSDVDLGLYYASRRPPNIDRVRAVAATVDPAATVTGLGEWGPYINGGAWLTVDGQRVDWLYRELDAVETAVAMAEQGQLRMAYQPGHPHGFLSVGYAAELHHAVVLRDATGRLGALKSRVVSYPQALSEAFMGLLWEADFSLDMADKVAARGDVVHVAGLAYRAVACAAHALHAANGSWCYSEKRAVADVDRLPRRPQGFATELRRVFARLGDSPQELAVTLKRLRRVVADVRTLCPRA